MWVSGMLLLLAISAAALSVEAQSTVVSVPEPILGPGSGHSNEPSQAMMHTLSEIIAIKRELMQLRNSIERLQFEVDNANRRQHDQLMDIDRRLVDIERGQQTLLSGFDRSSSGDEDPEGSGADVLSTVPGEEPAQIVVVPSGSDHGTVTIAEGTTAPQAVESNDQPEGSAVQATNLTSAPEDPEAVPNAGAVSLEEQTLYEQAFELLKQSRYEEAIRGFQELIHAWPSGELADDAYYWMSEARYVNREFEEALNGFETIVTRYPESQRVPEALLKLGYIRYDVGAYEDAAKTFRTILEQFPNHPVSVSAQVRLRRIEQTIQ